MPIVSLARLFNASLASNTACDVALHKSIAVSAARESENIFYVFKSFSFVHLIISSHASLTIYLVFSSRFHFYSKLFFLQ